MAIETLEPHLVEALRNSAQEILETMVMMTPTSIDAAPEEGSTFADAAIGMLGFTGTRSGTFVIRTSEAMAKAMAAKMLMMEPEEIEDEAEVADAFGEICNMLGGNFKNAWVATGNQMELSVPNVVFRGSVKVNSEKASSLRSCVRVQIDGEKVDIGVHFEAQD